MAFVLSHSMVGDPGAPRLGFFLHGVLGAGNNLRSLAGKLAKRRPEYRFCLPDLREHGASLGAPPPHTVEACAADLRELARAVGQSPSVILGHSFGGKVALQAAQDSPDAYEQVWLLDSNPGPQDPDPNHEVVRVLAALRATPMPAPDRASVVAALMASGISSGTANWLAMNLKLEAGQYRWALDFDAIETLMQDYFSRDLWPMLESPPGSLDIRVVVAERSDRWASGNRERLLHIPHAADRVHVVPNAGHWVHVDNPEFLLDLFASGLP